MARPGIGAPASDLGGIVSGIGDVLHVYAIFFERLGVSREDQVELLDRMIAELGDDDVQRAAVPRALRSMLLLRPKKPSRQRLAGSNRQEKPIAGHGSSTRPWLGLRVLDGGKRAQHPERLDDPDDVAAGRPTRP
jgi:hypothetical protein